MTSPANSQANPFRRTTIIIMFVIGFAAFIALLYGIGTGDRLASGKNGQAHGASNSIVGYKALANLLTKTGTQVQYSRSAADIDSPGLLVLTPNAYTEAAELANVMQERSYVGPTMIILPKWKVSQMPTLEKGWVQRFGLIDEDSGVDMLEDIADVELNSIGEPKQDDNALQNENEKPVKIDDSHTGEIASSAVSGDVAVPQTHVTIQGDYIRNIVADPENGEALIAYLDDGGHYPELDSLDKSQITDEDELDGSYYPLIIVADADLMNNAGMANKKTARHALALFEAASYGTDGEVTFDLTFNGLGSSENLLTLAFEPPFLSATICLIVAALAAAWMAFNRFGPPLREKRSIDFGKTALVNNSAGFMARMQREHLAADPYGEMIRNDAVSALGLQSAGDRAEINRKLDGLGEVDSNRFTALLNELNRATNARETAERAAALYDWKKEKIG